MLVTWSLFPTFCFFVLPLSLGSTIISCLLINFPIGFVSSSSSFDKKTCLASSWVISSLAPSFVSSSSLSFSSNYQICFYATSRSLVYFLICLKCHFLHSTLTSSSNSPISIRSCFMSSSYNIALFLFLVATVFWLVCKNNDLALCHL